MNEQIVDFIKEQTVATICCIDAEALPYCFTCFYAFNIEEGLIYFKSSPNSKHSLLIRENATISGTILPDKLNKMAIKGVQFNGEVLDPKHLLCRNASFIYNKSHPLAIAIKGEIFTIRLSSVKFTDSSMGFGRKIIWERNESGGLFVAYK